MAYFAGWGRLTVLTPVASCYSLSSWQPPMRSRLEVLRAYMTVRGLLHGRP